MKTFFKKISINKYSRYNIILFLLILLSLIVIFKGKVIKGKDVVIQGKVKKVKNGNSFVLNDKTIVLYGTKTFSLNKKCKLKNPFTKKWHKYSCGLYAKQQLEKLTQRHDVFCTIKKKTLKNHLISICYTKKYDRSLNGYVDYEISKELINSGLVTANKRHGKKYLEEERIAKYFKKGIWKGIF